MLTSKHLPGFTFDDQQQRSYISFVPGTVRLTWIGVVRAHGYYAGKAHGWVSVRHTIDNARARLDATQRRHVGGVVGVGWWGRLNSSIRIVACTCLRYPPLLCVTHIMSQSRPHVGCLEGGPKYEQRSSTRPFPFVRDHVHFVVP
jgi:hypothetical protein